MCRRTTRIGMLLMATLTVVALGSCGSPARLTQEGLERGGTSNAASNAPADTATMGTDFNGNKTPAAAFFGDRTYEQRQYDASTLRDEHVAQTDPGSYTVMIYLDGSTNLEDPNFDYNGNTFGSMTIDAILDSGVDPNKANIVIMTGGSDAWGHAGLEGNGNYILHVVKDGSGSDLSAHIDYHSEDPMNMGDPDTLRSFVDFAAKEYPADHYALMIWDHGSGPLYGCAKDENHNGDTLLLPEIADALDATDFGKGQKFDWIGFDCCLMGDLEVANTLSKYACYMIASQELETGVGGSFGYGTAWVYGFLDKLNTTASPTGIAAAAIDLYADGKELASSDRNTRTIYTMSLMDLTRVEAVSTALDGLFSKMTKGLEAGEYTNLAKLREYTKEFDEGGGLDLVDLDYMAWTLEELYPAESQAVHDAVNQLVLYQRTNVPEASGVSLYYPYRNEELYDKLGGRERYAQLGVSDGYLSYLEKFTDILINGEAGDDCEVGTPTATDEGTPGESAATDEYTIRLTEEQQKGIARISYNVLRKGSGDDWWSGGSGRYNMLLQDCQVAMDIDGVVHIPKNQTLLTLQGESGDQRVWPFKQVASGAHTAKYQSLATTIDGPFGPMAWTDSIPVTIVATETLGGSEPTISSINYRDEDDAIEGKSDVDIDRYDYLSNWVQPCGPEGNVTEPAWNWKQWDGVVAEVMPIDSRLSIGTTTTAELEGDYVLQVVFTDVHGEAYASELYELNSLGVPDKASAETDGSSYAFNVYDDHAVLTKVEGSATEITIPAECQGKPVTEIGESVLSGTSIKSVVVPDSVTKLDTSAFAAAGVERVTLPDGLQSIAPNAFSGCKSLSDIHLPQSLQEIGDSAFNECEQLAMLEIPASVTYIGDGAFQGCSRLRQLTVAEGNQAFKVDKSDEGNVLYTADGTELVSCPGLFHSSYKVADGTVRIRDRAFYGCYTEDFSGKTDGSEGHNVVGYGLAGIEFPESLKEIGDAAFFECNRLERIDLPKGLEIIGMEAFGSTDFTGTLGLSSVKFEKDTIDEVVIGKDVRWIGQASFNSFKVRKFIVDKDNQHYAATDGKLTTKDGKKAVDVYGE